MYRSSAIIIMCLMTAAFAGCLADSDTPEATQEDAATDTGTDGSTEYTETIIDLAPEEPVEPTAQEVPVTAPSIEDGETALEVELLIKDCIAKVGLLGIRISAC